MSLAAHATNDGDDGIPVLTLPKTLKAVREQLADDERGRLAAGLETRDVMAEFGKWWNVAAMRESSVVAAAVARYHAGGAHAEPIEEAAERLLRSA